MCGRIVQKSGPLDYVERIFPNPRRVFDDPAGPLYNIPPGTRPLTMHRLAGDFELERLHWGWRPHNSKYFMSSARLDKILAGAWPWKMLTPRGRILVPADGWYEWKPLADGPKPPKQPYYIHATDNAPLFFAGLSNWQPDALAKFGATVPSAIPDLLEPQLLTFASDRGMMVVGFEEIAGVRYYQGWWMQWVAVSKEIEC
ncbi:SOS response-associated peptidase family protein [Achromobacter dolens]|uniref:SOS response-associated peptidase family protein n=2 Tax=Achromobacter dolens TaxID=1287738 RepID=UPI000AEB119C|nr:SOS response-associated peptidase family protein [Achromobacter dolens]